MIEIVWDEPFLRILKKWRRKNPQMAARFDERLSLFAQNPFEPSLRTHRLSGDLKELWAMSISYQYRLVFKFLPENKALLIDLGTHDEVY
jgi:addiction module RelE/StbE family toxin